MRAMPNRMSRMVAWLGEHEALLLSSGTVLAVSTWVFLSLAGLIVAGRTLAIDDQILLALRDPDDRSRPIGPAWVADVARDITALGSTDLLWLVTLAVVGFLALDRRSRAAGFVLIAVLSGWAVSFVLKDSFGRTRPTVVPHLMPAYFSSFPSGHSMMAAVVYFTLGGLLASLVARRLLKFYFLALAAFLAGLVGLSRLVLGVHYPSDVVAGWAAGLAWATICWGVEQRLARRRTIEPTV